jgi:primosomal protein N' (replication factor Y)
MIDTIHQGQPSILLGTQLIAKGHHFPSVTLAIILEVDQGFLSADFRAIERTAQLILQTGGRSGRENLPGRVYLSSRLQALPELQALIKNDYLAFSKGLMTQRKTYQLPPYTYQGLLRADARKPHLADQFLRRLLDQYTALEADCEVLGPTSPVMEQRAGWYRSQLLVNAKTRQSRNRALQQLSELLTRHRTPTVRWSIDVDPVDLF